MVEGRINPQRDLWNKQHQGRGGGGPEGTILKGVPNDSAVMLATVLLRGSLILEIGSANGRDARRFAEWGHFVDCFDFSQVGLSQLCDLSEEEGYLDQISTYCYDISCGKLPESRRKYDAFFARSSLHLNDIALNQLADDITSRLKRNAFIIIEGKSPRDPKIIRSKDVGNGLVIDDDGHLRRVWDETSMINLATLHGWKVQQICELHEEAPEPNKYNHMMRLAAVV